MSDEMKPLQAADLTPLDAALILARRGDERVLPTLRRLLDEHPEIWQATGDLTRHAEASWFDRIAGQNLLLRESAARVVDALRDELSGPNPTPLEYLLVQRIVALHLQVQFFEASMAQHGGELPENQRPEFDRRYDAAHRRFTEAIHGLAKLRQQLPRPQAVEPQVRGSVDHTGRKRRSPARPRKVKRPAIRGRNRIADMLATSNN